MTRSEIQALVERFVTAWAGEDIEALLACYDEQVELVSPRLHVPGPTARIQNDLLVAASAGYSPCNLIDLEYASLILRRYFGDLN